MGHTNTHSGTKYEKFPLTYVCKYVLNEHSLEEEWARWCGGKKQQLLESEKPKFKSQP